MKEIIAIADYYQESYNQQRENMENCNQIKKIESKLKPEIKNITKGIEIGNKLDNFPPKSLIQKQKKYFMNPQNKAKQLQLSEEILNQLPHQLCEKNKDQNLSISPASKQQQKFIPNFQVSQLCINVKEKEILNELGSVRQQKSSQNSQESNGEVSNQSSNRSEITSKSSHEKLQSMYKRSQATLLQMKQLALNQVRRLQEVYRLIELRGSKQLLKLIKKQMEDFERQISNSNSNSTFLQL